MKYMRNRVCLAMVLTGVLTACSGAPSESDIKSALQKQMERERAEMQRFGGSMASSLMGPMLKVQDAKKVGCKDDGEHAYRCDVELQVEQGGRSNKGLTSLRLVKGSDGWTVSR